MVRTKFVDTYPADGPLLGARKLARSLGKLTPARNRGNVEDLEAEDFDPRDPTQNPPVFSWENPGIGSSDDESDTEDTPMQPTQFVRRRARMPLPDDPPTPPAGSSGSSQNVTAKNGRHGNRGFFPGRILTTMMYARSERRLMRGKRWTEEADLLMLYLRRKRVPFRRIASQFIVPMTGHGHNACQQRWPRLKSLHEEMSRADLATLEQELERIEREHFPNGIPPPEAEAGSPAASPPAQDGNIKTEQPDQDADGLGPAASAQSDTHQSNYIYFGDSHSTLTDLSSSPSPPSSWQGQTDQDD